MKILVTNDDGIYARGLWALAESLSTIAEVVVVAPDREQSAVGTSITLQHPLRAREFAPLVKGVNAYSVEGTPADCVILGLETLVEGKVGVVFSGINEGSNLGNDVLISGTVGAALQGYFRRLPSIAFSVAAMGDVRYDVAAKLAALLANRIAEGALPQEILLNVNVPNLPWDQIRGIELTRLAGRSYTDKIKEEHDGKRGYYWIVRGKAEWNVDQGTDIWAIQKRKISITPLQSNLTCHADLGVLSPLLSPLFGAMRPSSG